MNHNHLPLHLRLFRVTGGALLAALAVGNLGCQDSAAPQPIAEAGAPPASTQPALEPIPASLPRSKALPEEAIALVDRLEEDFPASVDALYARGAILEVYGQSNEAVQCWNECVRLDASFALVHEKLGQVAMQRGEFAEAAEHLARAVALQPDLPETGLNLGKALLAEGRSKDAAEALERHTKRHPNATEAWFRLGQAYFEVEDYERAKKSYESAVGTYDGCLPAWFGLAQAHERLGDSDRARECRERFLELDRNLTSADRSRRRSDSISPDVKLALSRIHTIAADVYATHGLSADAQSYWKKAAELDPTSTNCRQSLARSLAREGRAAEAIALFEELRKLQPQAVEHLLGLATLHQQLQQTDAAEKSLQQAIKLAPKNVAAPATLAQMYLASRKHLPEAERLALRVVELQPTAENYYLLSSACYANGNRGGARAALQEALRLEPNNPRYLTAANQLGKD